MHILVFVFVFLRYIDHGKINSCMKSWLRTLTSSFSRASINWRFLSGQWVSVISKWRYVTNKLYGWFSKYFYRTMIFQTRNSSQGMHYCSQKFLGLEKIPLCNFSCVDCSDHSSIRKAILEDLSLSISKFVLSWSLCMLSCFCK